MSKAKAVERMIFGSDMYTSKTLIKNYGSYSVKVAQEIFDKCREIDSSKIDIDIRPGHVLKSTFFKVVGINLNYEIKRLNEAKKFKGETKWMI